MKPLADTDIPAGSASPLCPVFGECGGCHYQALTYEEELAAKETALQELLESSLDLGSAKIDSVAPSPSPYHSRSKLDITLKKTRTGFLMGYLPLYGRKIVEIDRCAIARQNISDFLPELKRQAVEKMPADYRMANLVIKTGDDGRILWGGIGKRSLQLKEEDYLWTEINGVRIHYSLDTFFQANLDILPSLMEQIQEWTGLNREDTFYDLYSGVGLFGIYFARLVKKTVMIEDVPSSIRVAQFNRAWHGFENVEIIQDKVDCRLSLLRERTETGRIIAMIDPPRKGLSPEVCKELAQSNAFDKLLYLSCSPESLVRDLKVLTASGWKPQKVRPYDFFPKTRHLETLVLLEK